MKTALLFGSSGLIGGHLLNQLIKNNNYSKIKLFVRLTPEINNSKVEIIKTDFNNLHNHRKDINGNEIKKDSDFVQSLLENNGIAVVQGSAFGLEGFFRISYATSMESLKKALEKISSYCKSLS